MVFSNKEKAVIKNDFLERGWNADKICKEHPTKSWNIVSLHRLLKRCQEDRRAVSGRQRTNTNKNENLIENLICSQEDNPGSQMLPREVEKNTGISCTSIRRMIKRRGMKQFKHLKTTMMSSGMQERQIKRAGALVDRIGKNVSVEKCVWQDEKDFILDVPLNSQNSCVYEFEQKDNIQDNCLFHQTNRQSKKVMVSACVM